MTVWQVSSSDPPPPSVDSRSDRSFIILPCRCASSRKIPKRARLPTALLNFGRPPFYAFTLAAN